MVDNDRIICFKEVVCFYGKFSLNQGYIKKIPLNPALQKGEAFRMPGFIEMLLVMVVNR